MEHLKGALVGQAPALLIKIDYVGKAVAYSRVEHLKGASLGQSPALL